MSKQIDIDDELYRYIASHTQHIGESASAILRRLLQLPALSSSAVSPPPAPSNNANAAATRRFFDTMHVADLAGQPSIVARFLMILAALHRCHKQQFAKVLEISGRDRRYFARDEQSLLESGSSTNPKQIPDSDFFVVTNNNTTRKKMMLTQVALELGYTPAEAEQIRDLL